MNENEQTTGLWRETSVQELFDLSDGDMAYIELLIQDNIERSQLADQSTELRHLNGQR